MSSYRRYSVQAAELAICMKPMFILALMIGIGGLPNIPFQRSSAMGDDALVCREGFNQAVVSGSVNDEAGSDPLTDSVFDKSNLTTPAKELKTARRHETRFHQFITDAANRHEVEPEMIRAIIMAESSFNPKAVSRCGAGGLMQLMPGTAQSLGVKDVFDPMHNIEGGVRYFKRLLNRFNNNVELALAAYNAGSRNVRKYGGVPPYDETRFYIERVLRYYENYKQAELPGHQGT